MRGTKEQSGLTGATEAGVSAAVKRLLRHQVADRQEGLTAQSAQHRAELVQAGPGRVGQPPPTPAGRLPIFKKT